MKDKREYTMDGTHIIPDKLLWLEVRGTSLFHFPPVKRWYFNCFSFDPYCDQELEIHLHPINEQISTIAQFMKECSRRDERIRTFRSCEYSLEECERVLSEARGADRSVQGMFREFFHSVQFSPPAKPSDRRQSFLRRMARFSECERLLPDMTADFKQAWTLRYDGNFKTFIAEGRQYFYLLQWAGS